MAMRPLGQGSRTPRLHAMQVALGVGLLAALTAAGPVRAELRPEAPGRVETLPEPQPHWVWVADLLFQRSAVVDLDAGRFLGIVNGGYGTVAPVFPEGRPELYVPSTFYSRLVRGERTDVVTIFDAATLAPTGEVEIPPRRAIDAVPLAHAALSDDGRFLAVFNLTPATTLSIIDVERRAFVGEVSTPGCGLVFGAGPRRFLMPCGDGSALLVTLDAEGRELARARSRPFFDPERAPVTEKAVRSSDTWLFVSFEGTVHPVDVSGEALRFGEPWSLLDAADREGSWRVGGHQHLAVHERTGRLYALVHRGGPDTHKDPGEEVWVYDLESHARSARIELRHPGVTVHGAPLEIGRDWLWPFSGLWDWVLDDLMPPDIDLILVTRDDAPILVTASRFHGSLAIYDALSGEFLRRVTGLGASIDLLQAPYGGSAR